MRLDVNKSIAIVSSTYEYTVVKKTLGKDKKTGEDIEILTPIYCGHCNTLQQCCKTLIDNTIRGSKAINDMKQVLDEVRAMKVDIDKQLECLNVDKLTEEYKKYDKVRYDEDKGEGSNKESKIEDDESEEE